VRPAAQSRPGDRCRQRNRQARRAGDDLNFTSYPAERLEGRFAVPNDKSLSHRALILGALASGETRIFGLLEADDVMATVTALRVFGIEVERANQGHWHIVGGEWHSPAAPVDCGNSGTSARLLMGAAAGFGLTATFTGDESLRRRPMRRVREPLQMMGARFEGGDTLPLTLHGGELRGIEHRNVPASAQVKSAILLAGLHASGTVRVIEPQPTRDHSEIMLGAFGADVTTRDGVVELGDRRRLRGARIDIWRDPSAAAFGWVAAAIVPGSAIETRGVAVNPLRIGVLGWLERMGADVTIRNPMRVSGEQITDVTVRHARLRAIEVPAEAAPAMIDEYPLLAVAAAFAEGTSIFHGLGELRVKESDRLAAIVEGLGACGAAASIDGDTLQVNGGPVEGGSVTTYGDHRIAMAFLALGLGARGPVSVDRAEMIATSFPGFVAAMRGIGARIGESG
jgi:3-phosphoshikimate 1-carboxyvinyltransferase